MTPTGSLHVQSSFFTLFLFLSLGLGFTGLIESPRCFTCYFFLRNFWFLKSTSSTSSPSASLSSQVLKSGSLTSFTYSFSPGTSILPRSLDSSLVELISPLLRILTNGRISPPSILIIFSCISQVSGSVTRDFFFSDLSTLLSTSYMGPINPLLASSPSSISSILKYVKVFSSIFKYCQVF